MSIVFYGWWNAVFVTLLITSIAGDYIARPACCRRYAAAATRLQTAILIAAIFGNLALPLLLQVFRLRPTGAR